MAPSHKNLPSLLLDCLLFLALFPALTTHARIILTSLYIVVGNSGNNLAHKVVMHLSFWCPTTPLWGICGGRWGFDRKEVQIPHLKWKDYRQEHHLAPVGGRFDDQIPSFLPHIPQGGMVGHQNDRCICRDEVKKTWLPAL